MIQFWLNIIMFLMVYGIMIFLLRWKSAMRKPKKENGEGEGGISEEMNWDPDLDLPPGVVLPTGPHVTDTQLEEELV